MNKIRRPYSLIICGFACIPASLSAHEIVIDIPREITTWKTMRDEGVVRQRMDYSCGAASIATLLTGQFNTQITEREVLNFLPTVNRPYSLIDMARVLNDMGYDSIALRLKGDDLRHLQTPAILFMQPRRVRTTVGHFVVLRRIGRASVTLADPSLGNRTYSFEEFLSKWGTQNSSGQIEGVALLVDKKGSSKMLETEGNIETNSFFQKGERPIKFRRAGMPHP